MCTDAGRLRSVGLAVLSMFCGTDFHSTATGDLTPTGLINGTEI